MKISFWCCLFFLISFNSVFGQQYVKIKLDSLCTVNLPDTPKVKSSGINTGYFIGKEKERYIVLVQTFNKEIVDDVKDNVSSFYEGVINGTLNAANTKGSLIYKRDIIVDGLSGMEFEYQSTLDPKIPDVRFQRIVFSHNKLFNLCYWTFTSSVNDTEQNKAKFFNSFHISKQ